MPNGLLNGLVAYYKFDEASSADDFIDSHSGKTLIQSGNPPVAVGILNGARGFVPSDRGSISDPAFDFPGDYSAVFWWKVGLLGASQSVIAHDNTTAGQRGWGVIQSSSNRLNLYGSINGTTVVNVEYSAITLTLGTRYFVCIRRVGSDLSISVTPEGTGSLNAFSTPGTLTGTQFDPNVPFTFGCRCSSAVPAFTSNATGELDEMGLWSDDLSDVQFGLIYNSGGTPLGLPDYDNGVFTPGVLTEDAHTDTTVDLSWTASTGGTGSISEQLQISPSGAGTWSDVAGQTSSPGSATGLTASTAYDFRVRFIDSSGSPVTVYSNTVTVTTSSGTNTLTITTPEPRQIFQRSGNTGSIVITGTYVGSPTAIEAQWDGGAWETIEASPAGGVYSGSLTRTGGQGTLNVRFTNDPGASDSVSLVGVGEVFICAGQSNMSGRGTSNQSYTDPTFQASIFGNDYVWKNLTDPYDSATGQLDVVSSDAGLAAGSFIPLLATLLMDEFNVPVAFIPCAKGSTQISQHLPVGSHVDRSTLYGSANYRALQQTGGVKMWLWFQGETDAILGTSQALYNSRLDTLADAVFADEGVKLMACKLMECTDRDVTDVNLAIVEAWLDNPNVLTGPDLFEGGVQVGGDGVHINATAQLQLTADLWANAILSYYVPEITSQPESEEKNEGESVTFSVSATGIGPITYQWFFNGDAIPGETGETLEITGLTSANGGTYTVVVTNPAGSSESDPAELTVESGPIPAACDPQTLLDQNPCLSALSAWNLELVKTQLLCNLGNYLESGEPVTCDIQTLLDQASCFNALSPSTLATVQAQLLCNLVNYLDTAAPVTCDVQELLDDARCFNNLSPKMLSVIHTQLLCNLSNAL